MFNINVKDGTHAGWKVLYPARKAWFCDSCEKNVAKHWPNCPDCGASPEGG